MKFLVRYLMVSLICIPTLAVGQTAKDTGKSAKPVSSVPVSVNPERTTASFGDWVLRCESVGTPIKRVCEVAQAFTMQGHTAPIG
jgi:hypothetical protein